MTDVRRYIGPIGRKELGEMLRAEARADHAVERNDAIEFDREDAQLERLIERKIGQALLRLADKIDS